MSDRPNHVVTASDLSVDEIKKRILAVCADPDDIEIK